MFRRFIACHYDRRANWGIGGLRKVRRRKMVKEYVYMEVK
ncbi:hypothetical protein FOPG_18543 [Fusarium oxysporum f. sp. conglutinans race 2 54008]|uniref:Uncharacterized protein n=1 Tax=Fusarium oxysporum f. sp. conglutinans race 2 54008 TaxID=1089457 RepID=X0GNL3_FUSOX|nr:hypothetical protein FOPG_18543 [Fusarium oxysporum f. sp. conglutinans race 2 54008]